MVGLTQASVGIGAIGAVQTDDPITLTTGQWDAITGDVGGLVFNSIYWLDPTTAGRLTKTAPVTPGQVLAPVGLAVSTTIMIINILGTELL